MPSETNSQNWNVFWKAETEFSRAKISWSKRRILKLLTPYLSAGLKVLDAGAGSGFFSKFFLEKNCSVTALDYSSQALTLTRQNTENKCEEYLQKDLLDDLWQQAYAGKFDLIFTDGLFEHFDFERQQKILKTFKRLKSNSGIIATFVPNKYSAWTLIRPFLMPGIEEKPFTFSKLCELHKDFALLQSGGINVLPFKLSPEFLGKNLGMLLYCFVK